MIDRQAASRRVRFGIVTAIIAGLVVLVVGGVVAATGGLAGLGGPAGPAGATASGQVVTPSTSPSQVTGPAGASAASASPSAGPSAPGSPAPPSAPVSATGFRLRHTVVPMGFPLPAASNYRYGDRWRVPRVGPVYPYEEVRGRAADGTLLRAHDGVDLVVKTGTAVLATFDGIVIDPAPIWRPWDPARYGRVVVIRSTEISSPGYMAIVAHLSSRAVKVGDAVHRGQVVGWTGRTGNAAGTVPHLHFELRAPFTIPQIWGGIRRLLDVFDPLPSLLAADPGS
jgi:murein DD-endopeptidase MepM/ murein hydrolase activator NlpD